MRDSTRSARSGKPIKRKPQTTAADNRKPTKPEKPYPDFPLTPHPSGRWCKKIRGKLHYFGKWADANAALKLYQEQRDDLHAGRKPRVQADGVTIKDLCDHFLNAKRVKMEQGELSKHTHADYYETCKRIVDCFGRNRIVEDLRPDDFLALLTTMRKWGPVSRGNEVNRVRVVFRWGYNAELYEKMPRFGPDFKRPTKKTLRLERARKGPRMFTAQEIRAMVNGALVVGSEGPELAQANVPLRAMILLGVNAGLGNADCGRLPIAALDLENGWLNYHREKTGIPRRCPLWPETVAAVREAIERRPAPRDDSLSALVFLTIKGASWYKDTNDNPVSKEMAKLLKALGLNGHRNFYALRHTFRTVAGGARDTDAARSIMGHDDGSIDEHYIEGVSDDRLTAVTHHVRRWLFGA